MAEKIDPRNLHEVVGACIIYRESPLFRRGFEYLGVKRHPKRRIYPDLWEVPGGGMKLEDYVHLPQSSGGGWEAPLAVATRREVMEETGLEVGNMEMLSEFAFRYSDGTPAFGVRYAARYISGEVRLEEGKATEWAWLTAYEARRMDFLGGIRDAIDELDVVLKRRHIIGMVSI